MPATPEALDRLPRLRLGKLPTPLDEAPRLTRLLGGPRLLVKRDDLTGLATGGNKTRKLEFLVADAQAAGCDALITAGGPQSNHCRQTAAAAAIAGMECHLVLGGDDQPPIGNSLLDLLLGATLHWTPKERRNARMDELAEELRTAGKRPRVIPVGGSTPLGAVGYVAAMFELVGQLAERDLRVDHLLLATSSGGTQAGVVLGARLAGFTGKVTAISIDQVADADSDEKFIEGVCGMANGAAELLESEIRLTTDDFATNYNYLGGGYGVVGDPEREAIRLFAQSEGLLLGPVYTGRAAGAMIDLVRRGAFGEDETVLFWHTGDESALHAYAAELA
ncbi:L-cysteate sulfo-lyase [Pseudobythopirellula maris]|uniref:L-cysteate sulfo-lyase n=1 Tax=Pseudobythopirellula maris TaxID=2527991 RepID=A0A5C5ZNN2_9BACT|nr:D-cysteine desulfhydrase family protein [Pseudobythopirellula maris]TWT88736.1 L-cysteate sulfo-lyase [Pseudobythopirellula maris]